MTEDLSKKTREAYLHELPLTSYNEALEIQRRLAACIHEKKILKPLILILEHNPVFTAGRHGGRENLTVSREFLNQRKIPVVEIERGGNITYHGPGQLVVYPLMNLEAERLSVKDYVWALEEVMTGICDFFCVKTSRNRKNHGIWVENKKIGSVGIALRHGVSFHGFALNINPSLEPFSWINPCGLKDIGVTSIENEYGRLKKDKNKITMQAARQAAATYIQEVFGFRLKAFQFANIMDLP